MIGEEYRAEVEKSTRKRRVGSVQQMLGLLLSVVLIWLLFGRDAPDRGISMPDAPAPRVASMSPAITDSLAALGLAAHVVGRSGFCTSVDRGLPVVGDLRSFDAERLAIARPAILFVQPPLAGVDPALREYCEGRGIALVERRLDSLADLSALLTDIERAFDGALPASAAARVLAIRSGLEAASAACAADPAPDAPRVVVALSADPFLVVGGGSYLDELLEGAGAINAIDRDGWVELSVEQLLAIAPDRFVALADSREAALELANRIEVLPWKGGEPIVVPLAAPQLLVPSLAAIEARSALAEALGDAGSAR